MYSRLSKGRSQSIIWHFNTIGPVIPIVACSRGKLTLTTLPERCVPQKNFRKEVDWAISPNVKDNLSVHFILCNLRLFFWTKKVSSVRPKFIKFFTRSRAKSYIGLKLGISMYSNVCMKVSHSVCYNISGVFLRKQNFYLNQDKLLPNLQHGFLWSEAKCCSQQKYLSWNVFLNNIVPSDGKGCTVMSSKMC